MKYSKASPQAIETCELAAGADVLSDLKLIYRAANREEAEHKVALFEGKWDSRYRSVSQLWRRHWEQLAFPAEEAVIKVL